MNKIRLLALTALAGCTGSARPAADTAPPEPPVAATRDSLVLEAPGGVTVWFTGARTATDSAGTPCVERALEVRRDTTRRGVPLLYTREAPILMDGGAMRAVLYNGCRAGPAYRVDFVTVNPQKLSR